jgi:FdrA protein
MPSHTIIRKNQYYDSVRLMAISRQASASDGVRNVLVLLGSESNKKVLEDLGLLDDEARAATANDLMISIDAQTEEAGYAVLTEVDNLLATAGTMSCELDNPVTIEGAIECMNGANMALFSVPGQFARLDVAVALNSNLHVMLFSDNVPVEDEVYLKRLAEEKDLLMMGPDCGTAIINGVPLAFANVMRRGDIGIVGASGTGIQEVCSLIDRYGGGVSHAIGVGGRDLKAEVGGIMMRHAIRQLAIDPNTKRIVLISKPADPAVMQTVLEEAGVSAKQVVACILGATDTSCEGNGVIIESTLERAALRVLNVPPAPDTIPEELRSRLASVPVSRRYLRGLFSGGTLCHEALLLFQEALPVSSNVALVKERRLTYPCRGTGHYCIDMGDDDFTRGAPHPMIDSSSRSERLIEEFLDPDVRVILLDVVLGYGASADPAGDIASALSEARKRLGSEDPGPIVIAYVCGTAGDPQSMTDQENRLREVGVYLSSTNAQAARSALWAARNGN